MHSAAIQETIEKAKVGDHAAFEHLYRAYKRTVYGICLRMVRNTADAEDLTQDVFVQLHRKLSTFRGEAAFSTWLHRLTVNSVLMKLRRAQIATVSFFETAADDETEMVQEFGITDANLVGAVDRITLERAVCDLPPGYRLVFILHDIEGYEHGEIADILGCTVGNCKSQLHKARLRLRSALLRSTVEYKFDIFRRSEAAPAA